MYGFTAIVFDGKKTARKALDTLEDREPVFGWIDDVAVLSRSKYGAIKVDSTWAQDDSEVGASTGFGAVTGALIGLLLGPGGALFGGLMGGSLGAILGGLDDIAWEDPRLDDLADALKADSSALILVGEKTTLADFASAAEPLGGEVIETDLNEDDIKAIRKALKNK